MANRHRSRALVLQALFEWDFHGQTASLSGVAERLCVDMAVEESEKAFETS